MDRAFVSELFNGTNFLTTFSHPESFKDILSSLTPEEFQMIMPLGVAVLKEFKESVNNVQYQEALTKEIHKHTLVFESERRKLQEDLNHLIMTNEKELSSLKLSHKNAIQDLNTEIREIQSNLSSKEFSLTKARELFETLKKDSESLLKISIQEILKQKDEQHEKEIQRIQTVNKIMCETLEKQANERVLHSDIQHEKEITRIQEKYNDLESKNEKSLVSSEKGKQGEKEFEDLVKEYVLWPPLVNTSKVAHATDRGCKIRKCNTLFEIKNYTTDVPTKELEKFERDMEENQNAPLGVFVSMKTNITGKKSGNFITMKWTSKSQLLLFVNNFYAHSPEDILTFIDLCADIAWTVYSNAQDTPSGEDVSLYQLRIEQAKVYIEKEIKRMADFMKEVNHDKNFMIDKITTQHAKYKYNIEQTQHSLKGTLDILFGNFETEPEIPEESPKKPKSRVKKPSINPS